MGAVCIPAGERSLRARKLSPCAFQLGALELQRLPFVCSPLRGNLYRWYEAHVGQRTLGSARWAAHVGPLPERAPSGASAAEAVGPLPEWPCLLGWPHRLCHVSLSRLVPHWEVQSLLSEVPSDPTPHCQKLWHLLLLFHSLLCIFFLLFFSSSLYVFPSFLLLFLLSLVPQALIFRFLSFLGFTGSVFDSISVISRILFQRYFPLQSIPLLFKATVVFN